MAHIIIHEYGMILNPREQETPIKFHALWENITLISLKVYAQKPKYNFSQLIPPI